MESYLGLALSFILTLAVGLGLVYFTFRLSSKSGITALQHTLIDNLQENVSAMDTKTRRLETDLAEAKGLALKLEKKVNRLTGIILEIVSENQALRKRIGMPARLHPLELVVSDDDGNIEDGL